MNIYRLMFHKKGKISAIFFRLFEDNIYPVCTKYSKSIAKYVEIILLKTEKKQSFLKNKEIYREYF